MNRRYFITGAASGIGKALAEQLLASGARICAADVQDIDLTGGEAHLLIQKLDVRDPGQWATAWDRAELAFGGIDVLLNVAGVIRPGYIGEITPDDIDFHLDINTKGVMLGTALAARRMAQQESRGHIVNIASLAGIAPVPGISLYSASKFAVRGFTLAAAAELRDKGIQITAVCPDAVQTPMLDLEVDYEQAAMAFSAGHILGVQEVVDVILQRVLVKAPIEVTIPRGRGLLAKLASAWPGIDSLLLPGLIAKGQKRQQQIKAGK